MTPKEKAIELVESMAFSCRECDYEFKVKQCALIAVDEIIKVTERSGYAIGTGVLGHNSPYWQEVKQEIEKL